MRSGQTGHLVVVGRSVCCSLLLLLLGKQKSSNRLGFQAHNAEPRHHTSHTTHVWTRTISHLDRHACLHRSWWRLDSQRLHQQAMLGNTIAIAERPERDLPHRRWRGSLFLLRRQYLHLPALQWLFLFRNPDHFCFRSPQPMRQRYRWRRVLHGDLLVCFWPVVLVDIRAQDA